MDGTTSSDKAVADLRAHLADPDRPAQPSTADPRKPALRSAQAGDVNVKVLREAARLMRERAEAATAGPWIAHSDGLVWPVQAIPGDPVSGSTELADAQHIASWHPLVALAVAKWVDGHAIDLSFADGDPGKTDSPCDLDMALKVARAYLAGDWS